MIKNDKGMTVVEGTIIQTKSEFASLVKGVKELLMNEGRTEEEAKKEIMECVEIGIMPEKEFDEKVDEAVKKLQETPLGSLVVSVLLGKPTKGDDADE